MSKKLAELGPWYLDQRTRSLATIYLTRLEGILITEADQDEGVDLNVTIRPRREAVNRRFGVILRGTTQNVSEEQVSAIVKPQLEALTARAFPFPVCLFFFKMENDEGYYTWVVEPGVTEGTPVLEHQEEPACRKLDTPAVETIVGQVNAWYDAFYSRGIEERSGRQKKNGIEVLHGIIDGEAGYFAEHGQAPTLLKLPIAQAFELAKLGREHLGDLAGQIIKQGARALEKEGLLGMKVTLVTNQPDFSFE